MTSAGTGTRAVRRDRLTALDAAFLSLESAGRSMNVAALLVLDPSTCPGGRLDVDRLTELVGQRVHRIPRLRQRLMEVPHDLARPVWVDHQSFDVGHHVRHVTADEPGSRRDLEAVTGAITQLVMDRSQPLWDFTLIDGLEDGRAAVLVRWQHALVDGLSAMELVRVMCDRRADNPPCTPVPWQPEPLPSPDQLVGEALAERSLQQVRSVWSRAVDSIDYVTTLDRRGTLFDGLLAFLAPGPAERGPFNVDVAGRRTFATATVPMSDVKLIGRRLGVTPHDVVLSAVAGGIHRLLAWRGDPTRGRKLRTMVPVGALLRPDRADLGNHNSFFFVDLPIGPCREEDRIRAVASDREAARLSKQAETATKLIEWAEAAPPSVGALIARSLNQQDFANLVVSYMGGPPWPLYLGGARLVGTYPVLPLAPRLALLVGAVSLGGELGFGLTADADAVDDVEWAALGILEAFGELLEVARA